MCSDCPVLEKKLHGTEDTASHWEERGLVCHHCHTSVESLRTGGLLGCSDCYGVFEDFIRTELINADAIATQMRNAPSGFHLGRAADMPSSHRLAELNQSLNEALRKEDYEKAAYLRDQIKEVTDDPST